MLLIALFELGSQATWVADGNLGISGGGGQSPGGQRPAAAGGGWLRPTASLRPAGGSQGLVGMARQPAESGRQAGSGRPAGGMRRASGGPGHQPSHGQLA